MVIEQACRRCVSQDNPQLRADVTEDLTAIFRGFLSSEPYARLQRATVLGREVQFVMHTGEGQITEGVIDLIYRLDGQTWVADYKTDDAAAEDLQAVAGRYRSQMEMYSRAVMSSLGLSSVSLQVIFLRPGVVIDV
jgi:ATP-dependent helicase/nuclease subunit A